MFDKLKRVAGLLVKWLSLSISCYAVSIYVLLWLSPERLHRCFSMMLYDETDQIQVAMFLAIVLVNAISAIIILWRKPRAFNDMLFILYHAFALIGFTVLLTIFLMFMIPRLAETEDALERSFRRARMEAIDRETVRQMVLAIPKVMALEVTVIANGGIGLAVHVDEAPVDHFGNGHRYWEVSVYENYYNRHPRYETFLVCEDGEEILIRNFMEGAGL